MSTVRTAIPDITMEATSLWLGHWTLKVPPRHLAGDGKGHLLCLNYKSQTG